MTKKEISWAGLIKMKIEEKRKEGQAGHRRDTRQRRKGKTTIGATTGAAARAELEIATGPKTGG